MELFKKLKDGNETIMLVFPHAGSGPTQYRALQKSLPGNWQLNVLCLPGREEKVSQTFFTSWNETIKLIDAEVTSLVKHFKTVVMFGHSMGAWFAFETLNNLNEILQEKKTLYVTSGMRPPDQPSIFSELTANMSDEEFYNKLSDIEGIPEELKKNKDFLKIYMNAIKADLKLLLNANLFKNLKVNYNIMAIAANKDPVVDFQSVCQWKNFTSKEFKLIYLTGGHFSVLKNINNWVPQLTEFSGKL